MRDAAALIIMKLDATTLISSLAGPSTPVATPTQAPKTAGSDEEEALATAVAGEDDEAG